MRRLASVCLLLCLVGCAQKSEKEGQPEPAVIHQTPPPPVFSRPSSAAKPEPKAKPPKAAAAQPQYDPDEPPVRTRPRPSAALKKEAEAYLNEPPIKITAAALVKAYLNESAADELYKEHKVWVTGYVLRTARGTVGTPYVELEPGKTEGGSVRCFFEKGETDFVDDLKEGQEVTIEGRVYAKTGNEVRVQECHILTPAAIRAITSAARDLEKN